MFLANFETSAKNKKIYEPGVPTVKVLTVHRKKLNVIDRICN
jgi:hypothetical protein